MSLELRKNMSQAVILLTDRLSHFCRQRNCIFINRRNISPIVQGSTCVPDNSAIVFFSTHLHYCLRVDVKGHRLIGICLFCLAGLSHMRQCIPPAGPVSHAKWLLRKWWIILTKLRANVKVQFMRQAKRVLIKITPPHNHLYGQLLKWLVMCPVKSYNNLSITLQEIWFPGQRMTSWITTSQSNRIDNKFAQQQDSPL